jgi:predicted transposase YdaD
LTQTPDKAETLRQVAKRVEAIADMRVQSNVAASAGILAGLTLKQDFINQVLRKEIMRQSVIYQEILQEGEQTGIFKGEQALIFRLLTRRVGNVAPEVRSQIQSLSLPQLESLGEALLDFSQPDDLVEWLRTFGA